MRPPHVAADTGMTPLSTAAPSDSSASSYALPSSPLRGLGPYPGAMLLAGVAPVAGLPVPAVDASGAPFVYPNPLQIRHTFLEVVGQKSMAIEEGFKERRARSAPVSGLDDPLLQWQPEKQLLLSQATFRFHSEQQDESSRNSDDLNAGSLPRTPQSEDFPEPLSASQTALIPASSLAPPSCMAAGPTEVSCSARPVWYPPPPEPWSAQPPHAPEEAAMFGGSAGAAWTEDHCVQQVVADEAIPSEAFGMPFPSKGSLGHYDRNCKPCAFLNTKGCENGYECPFCHLCEPGEKKRRRKEKMQLRNAVRHFNNVSYRGFSDFNSARWKGLA